MVLVSRSAIAALALLSATARPALAATATTAQCPFPALSRPYTMSDPSPSSPEFLQDRLAALLASPHIHITKPPALAHITKPPALAHIRMGPGPVDVFSSRFANWFSHDATGVVNGKQVDKDGLKEALLALQKKWHPESASFAAQGEASKPTTKFAWTVRNAQQPAEVTASADVKEEGGTHRISSLVLDGDESLFSS